MTDPRSRRGLPERWLLPPPPRDPVLADRWRSAGFDERRRWARIRADERPQDDDLVMAVALAHARLATSWRLLAGAPLLGWLVLMTVWGFGRSTYPDRADAWLLAGLGLGATVWLVAAIHTTGRLRRARAMAEVLPQDTSP